MPTLGFLSIGDKKYTLKHGETYVVGCMSQDYVHDIEINDKSVDIKHCILDFTEPVLRIFDIKSKCGTFVDHERIPSYSMLPLKKSTNIQIGCVDAILELAVGGDSGFLEDRVSPQSTERQMQSNRQKQEQAHSNLDHQFAVPAGTARSLSKSRNNSRTNESFDSFTIPETQVPPKEVRPEVDDDEDSFYIPETQDAITAVATLNNYPRVAFENEDVNETVADFDKIPSSQFRICTQDFNGSADESSNNSDDILANVPCSLVIPAIRHSTIHINDDPDAEDAEVEKELSALRWSKSTAQTTRNSITPDGICAADNQEQPKIPKQSSQCSTPDIFADNDPLVDDMEKSLKENDPPSIALGSTKPTDEIQKTSIKNTSTPNGKPDFQELSVENSALPPTQLFVFPKAKVKPAPIADKQKPVSIVDELPPTQVFQAAPPKLKTGSILSSTLLDAEMQLSESSFKAKCNKLLDSDDDEMDEVVAPELVQKYRQSLENTKEAMKTPNSKETDNFATPQPENIIKNADNEKMLPPKSVAIPAGDDITADGSRKRNPESVAIYANIDDFLCTPDFLGREFAKEGNLQRVAEQNWKNQRKPLFQDEETPKKPIRNESDDSQDSFTDLISNKMKQVKEGEKSESKLQAEPVRVIENKLKLAEVEVRVSRRRQTTLTHDITENKSLRSKTVPEGNSDGNTKSKQRKRRSAKFDEKTDPVRDQNDESSEAKKSKESRGEGTSKQRQRTKNTSAGSTSGNGPNKNLTEAKDIKQKSHDKNDELSGAKSNHCREEDSSKHWHRSEKDMKQTTNEGSPLVKADFLQSEEKGANLNAKRVTRLKSTTLSDDKAGKPPQEGEKASLKEAEAKRVTRRKSTTSSDDKAGKPPQEGEKASLKEAEAHGDKKFRDSKVASRSASHEDKVRTDQKWAEKRNLEVVLHKNGIKKHAINSTKSSQKSDSDGLSRTRSKTKSSEVDGPKETNIRPGNKFTGTDKDERESSSALDSKSKKSTRASKDEKESSSNLDNKSKKSTRASRDEKETVSTLDGKLKKNTRASKHEKESTSTLDGNSSSRSESKSDQASNKEVKSVTKRTAVNKSEEKEKVDKPLRRVTRLRSAKQIGPSPSPDMSSESAESKSTRPSKNRIKPPEEPEGNQSSHDTIDLTDQNTEEQSNSGTLSNGVKRKNSEEAVESKRIKSSNTEMKPQSKPKIAMTMCDHRYQEVLEKHSGIHWVYTTDPKECDVLILEKSNRTYKLMVAIARGIPVLKLDWLKEVLKKKSTAVPMDEYIFEDTQFQERHQFVMKKSLSLAKSTSLFKGMNFMMTPNIRPSPKEMKDIITCAGGVVLEQMPKQKQQVFLVSHPNDNQYWHQYRRSNANVRIVTTEGVMASVMQQSRDPLTRSIIQ